MFRRVGLCLAVLACFCAPAFAFGTVSVGGQHREHEMITRNALVVFGPKTMDELAGTNGSFGAVGSPDNLMRGPNSVNRYVSVANAVNGAGTAAVVCGATGGTATPVVGGAAVIAGVGGLVSDCYLFYQQMRRGDSDMFDKSWAHCDNGDYTALVPSYPQTKSQAQKNLTECQTWIFNSLERSLREAGPLAKPTAENTALGCDFMVRIGQPAGSVKCTALKSLGEALHATEDFYSHSNWADQEHAGPITVENPKGLHNLGRAPWLDPRKPGGFPEGLISGCFEGLPELNFCYYAGPGGNSLDHIKHAYLNKDFGTGEMATGVFGTAPNSMGRLQLDAGSLSQLKTAGSTPRGQIGTNFQRAVYSAIDDANDKWLFFQERAIKLYGPAPGLMIICVMEHDDYRDCLKKPDGKTPEPIPLPLPVFEAVPPGPLAVPPFCSPADRAAFLNAIFWPWRDGLAKNAGRAISHDAALESRFRKTAHDFGDNSPAAAAAFQDWKAFAPTLAKYKAELDAAKNVLDQIDRSPLKPCPNRTATGGGSGGGNGGGATDGGNGGGGTGGGTTGGGTTGGGTSGGTTGGRVTTGSGETVQKASGTAQGGDHRATPSPAGQANGASRPGSVQIGQGPAKPETIDLRGDLAPKIAHMIEFAPYDMAVPSNDNNCTQDLRVSGRWHLTDRPEFRPGYWQAGLVIEIDTEIVAYYPPEPKASDLNHQHCTNMLGEGKYQDWLVGKIFLRNGKVCDFGATPSHDLHEVYKDVDEKCNLERPAGQPGLGSIRQIVVNVYRATSAGQKTKETQTLVWDFPKD